MRAKQLRKGDRVRAYAVLLMRALDAEVTDDPIILDAPEEWPGGVSVPIRITDNIQDGHFRGRETTVSPSQIVGTPEECREAIAAYRREGIE